MSYRHPSETDACIHIATTGDWNSVKVFMGLKPLCGVLLLGMKDFDSIVTVSDLEHMPLADDEYLCPFCLEHEDYPLLVLACVGE